jgi:DNA-binding SARP family transcriptional activator
LRRFGEGLAQARPIDVAYYHFLCNWEALGLGDLGAAEWHADEVAALRERVGLTFGYMLIDLTKARTCIARGRFEEARPALEEVHRLAAATGSKLIEYMVCIEEALLSMQQGDETSLRQWLTRAFRLGREQGLVTFHGWQAAPMARLCAHALEAGIETEYVQALISRRALIPPLPASDCWPWPLKIYTLGKFELISNGKPMLFSGKVQQKPLALLKALIALGGKDVAEEQFADILWPEAEGDLAHKSFEMTVQRLRRLIGNPKIFQLQERRLSLDPSLCWIDVWELVDLLEKVEAAWKSSVPSAVLPTEVLRLSEKAINLYRGHFLPGDSTNAWVLSCRERLRSKFLRLITRLGCYWEENHKWNAAIELFQKGLEVDALTEEFYRHLMFCHKEMGHRAEALAVYSRCHALLLSSLGIPPSQKVEELYRSIKNTQ